MPAAIIFDLDGTLVSSTLDFAAMRAEIACPESIDILDHIARLPASEQAAAQAVIRQHEQRDAAQCALLPGVAKALAVLHTAGVPMAVVTRNSRAATRQKLAVTGLQFDLVLTREDAPAKPDPSALLQVAAAWQLEPAQCAYLGDYVYDLQAARAARMHAWLYAPEPQLPGFSAQADSVLRCFSELAPRMGIVETNFAGAS